MNKKTFLFTFDDDSTYLAENVNGIKEALVQTMEYYGGASDFFQKSLVGFDEDDIKTIVNLYVYFARYHANINSIYEISQKIY